MKWAVWGQWVQMRNGFHIVCTMWLEWCYHPPRRSNKEFQKALLYKYVQIWSEIVGNNDWNLCLWLNADTHHHIITFFFLSDMTTTIRDPQEGTQTCWLVSFQTRQMVPQGLISCAPPPPHLSAYVLELGHIFHWWTTTQLNLFNMWGTTSISQQYQTEERFKTFKKKSHWRLGVG